jgi:hypothetical protein
LQEDLAKEFNGQYCTIGDVVRFLSGKGIDVPRSTVVWNVNELMLRGKAIRVGRGVYGFIPKPIFEPKFGASGLKVVDVLRKSLKYLDLIITETSGLGQFMNLLPFASLIVIEVRKQSVSAVVSNLRKEGIEAIEKTDYASLEKYIESSEPIVVRPILSVNPPLKNEYGVKIASIEKMLVDIVCDAGIYGQYQGEELVTIYRNATDRYAINYSRMLRYASGRKRKPDVTAILSETDEYRKVRDLL